MSMISIPPREQRHVDGSNLEEDPSLEDNAARTGHFEPIAVRCRFTRRRPEFTVWPMEFYKFPQIFQQ